MTQTTTYEKIKLEDVRSAKYDLMIERYGEDSNTCFICGKRTASGLWVHYTTDDELVNESNDELVPNSQGAFPIGKDCAKKLPKSFIFQ